MGEELLSSYEAMSRSGSSKCQPDVDGGSGGEVKGSNFAFIGCRVEQYVPSWPALDYTRAWLGGARCGHASVGRT